jgi:phosphate transport system substrate-binding protein
MFRRSSGGAAVWLLGISTAVAVALVIAGGFVWYSRHDAPETLLRIHGSNTMGDRLMPELVRAFMEQEEKYAHVQDEVDVIGERDGVSRRIKITAHGSQWAFRDLLSGSADIGMSSDRINEQERKNLLPTLGDLTSNEGEHVIALDGIAVIVNPANQVSGLSRSQVADIFSGSVKDWSELGGQSGDIHVYALDKNSGTWRFFDAAVLEKFHKTLVPDCVGSTQVSTCARRFEKNEELSDSVAQDPQGIGFVGGIYANRSKIVALSDQGVGARTPSFCTVKTEEYILSRRLYLYTSAEPTPIVDRFIRFATSKAAWPIVTGVGLVNMDPTPLASCNSPGTVRHSAEWFALTQGAERLLTNFNFAPAGHTLDTKAYLSLGYAVGVLSRAEYANNSVVLIGYTDAEGGVESGRALSLERAKTVCKILGPELARRAVRVSIAQVAGLGGQDFIAPNVTAEDRAKNRRVEVWIRETVASDQSSEDPCA